MSESNYEFHFAPLQGYADYVFRNAFEKYFGGVDVYYTPFVRLERGEFRRRDLRDIDPENNRGQVLVPQILPGSRDEFCLLADMVSERGYRRVDLNFGCPFPLIAGKRKGAGILPYPDSVYEVLQTIKEYPEIVFSLKMRLGWEKEDECLALVDMLNDFPLKHVILHARTGKQQYKGSVCLDAFAVFYERLNHPLLYNGDILTIEDIDSVTGRFPALKGVAVGRGLLANPWLIAEYKKLDIGGEREKRAALAAFHQELYGTYAEMLQGEAQLLNKMKSFWEYFLPMTDRKLLKMIRKSNRISQYSEAVKLILGQ